MTLSGTIDLSNVVYASLNFWAKWDIEAGYDYVQVLISNDNGASWIPAEGKYTHPGNSNQAAGEPLYDGTQNTWIKEEISLAEYLGQQIRIRFRLISDVFETGDGFFWDDMTVTVVDVETGLADDRPVTVQNQLTVYPNPASGLVNVKYNRDFVDETIKLKVLNSIGQIVYETKPEKASTDIIIDASTWIPGVYYCCIEAEKVVWASCKLIIR